MPLARDRLKAIVSRRGDPDGTRGPDTPPFHLDPKTIETVCDPVRLFWGRVKFSNGEFRFSIEGRRVRTDSLHLGFRYRRVRRARLKAIVSRRGDPSPFDNNVLLRSKKG